ncbi:hypothetical protein IEQ34_016408 [Dendrobium chrysotoxum]|uniref:DUF674 family protein n=1 Tax=Dendrobium chrysotoxum TaxID=161865 RepID=A0AAV7FXZ9_DENCH|nr:hypothetical protein IEQ34_016408 [Dendrobium chrysotoxum]
MAAVATAAMTHKLSIKLLIDKERNRVVFAETDKDFVDILFSFLTLPMGSIIRLLGKKTGVGSMDRLYESVAKFDERCFQTPACRAMLLSPRSEAEIRCKGLALELDEESEPWIYYRCLSSRSYCAVSSVFGARCPCGGTTEAPILALGWQGCEGSEKGFVRDSVNFIVSDDLVVQPASIGASLALINELGIDDGNVLQKKTVHLNREEVLNLLKRALVSNIPLTDVFLQEPDTIDCAEKLPTKNIIQAREKPKISSDNNMKIPMKLFLSKDTDKVVYAEASEELVDLLFSFLTFPLGSIIKLLGKKSSLGCMDNLYKSIELLSSPNYIISNECKEMLSSPKLAPFFGLDKQLLQIEEAFPRTIKSCACKTCFSFSSATRCLHGHNVSSFNLMNPKLQNSGLELGGGYVKGMGWYLITDEMEVSPLSPITSVHIINKLMVPISGLEEVTASLGEAEALDLLRACLISDEVLSDVFSPYLLKLLQQNWLGFFPCKSDG